MKKVAAIFFLLVSPCFAQQQNPPPRALERLAVGLGQCQGILEDKLDQLTDLQKRLSAAEARVKELEESSSKK